jgi:hypothetical protein
MPDVFTVQLAQVFRHSSKCDHAVVYVQIRYEFFQFFFLSVVSRQGPVVVVMLIGYLGFFLAAYAVLRLIRSWN